MQGLRTGFYTRFVQERAIADDRFARLETGFDGRVAIAIEALKPRARRARRGRRHERRRPGSTRPSGRSSPTRQAQSRAAWRRAPRAMNARVDGIRGARHELREGGEPDAEARLRGDGDGDDDARRPADLHEVPLIAEFETRLADVLAGVLPAPFTGRVEVAPGSAVGAEPLIVLGVRRAEPLDPDLGSNRPELAPGVDGHRRILRLACTVGVEVVPATGQGRQQQVEGVDAALYALEAPNMRDGRALVEAGDAGFLIQQLEIVDAAVPFTTGAGPATGSAGAQRARRGLVLAGRHSRTDRQEDLEVHVRGAGPAARARPGGPVLTAGGPAVDLAVRVRAIGSLRITERRHLGVPLRLAGVLRRQAGWERSGPGDTRRRRCGHRRRSRRAAGGRRGDRLLHAACRGRPCRARRGVRGRQGLARRRGRPPAARS